MFAPLAAVFLTIILGGASDSVPAKQCSAATAKLATIEAIQTDYPSWAGLCVKIRGIQWGTELLSSRTSLLEESDWWSDERKGSIILLSKGRLLPMSKPRWVELVGTVSSCKESHAFAQAMQEKNPGSIYMTTGFCHMSSANFIGYIKTRRIEGEKLIRLTEADVAPERRPLVRAPDQFPELASHQVAARDLVLAIATGNESEFVRLSDVNIDHAKPDKGDKDRLKKLRKLFAQDRKIFPLAGIALADRQMRTFISRSDAEAADPDDLSGRTVSCWCKEAECSGKWPVTWADVDYSPKRPYYCIFTEAYGNWPTSGWIIQANTIFSENGLGEPVWQDR